jgi:hypothetical protein
MTNSFEHTLWNDERIRKKVERAMSGKSPDLARSLIEDYMVHYGEGLPIPEDVQVYLWRAFRDILNDEKGKEDKKDKKSADAHFGLKRGPGRKTQTTQDLERKFNIYLRVTELIKSGHNVQEAIDEVADGIPKNPGGADRDEYVRAAYYNTKKRIKPTE